MHKEKELSPNPRHPCERSGMPVTPSQGGLGGGRGQEQRQVDPKRLLASYLSRNREFRFSETPCLPGVE